MGFSREYLVSMQCAQWRTDPALLKRREAWPEVLTWAWYLDPERVSAFDRADQLQVLSVATAHAHKVKAELWAKPIRIYRTCQQLAAAGDEGDSERFELYRRLAAELDTIDAQNCAASGVELVEPRKRGTQDPRLLTREQRQAARVERRQAAGLPPSRAELRAESFGARMARAAAGRVTATPAGLVIEGGELGLERAELEHAGAAELEQPAAELEQPAAELEQPAAELEQPAAEQPAAERRRRRRGE